MTNALWAGAMEVTFRLRCQGQTPTAAMTDELIPPTWAVIPDGLGAYVKQTGYSDFRTGSRVRPRSADRQSWRALRSVPHSGSSMVDWLFPFLCLRSFRRAGSAAASLAMA